MIEQMRAFIVRIFVDGRDTPVGLGFLAAEKHVLTCAHVIAQALGIPQDSPDAPKRKIRLDFPLLAPGTILSSHVVFWQPVQSNSSPALEYAEDIAVLELETSLPDEAHPAHLVMADDLWKHPFRTFGFPKGYDEGVWAEGELLERQAKKRIQIEAVKVPGYRVMQGFSGSPVWDSQLNGVVGMVVESDKQEDVKAAYITPTDVLLSAWPGLSQPYRGLAYFREEDVKFFYGREAYTKQVLEAVQKKPLVIVTGPSGSGKSSVIFAGLIPHLRKERDWLIITFRPGDRPFHALVAVLLPSLESKMNETDWLVEIKKLGDRLYDGTLELQDVAGRILQKNSTYRRLLLYGDQFEELYTLCQDQQERQRFLEILLPTTNQYSRMFTLIMTLRADFLGQALSDPPFADAFNNASQESTLKVLTSMNRQELRSAIEMPANKLHVQIQRGLTERILDAVGKQAGSLPLLEFALTLLWAKQEKGLLTHAAYDDVGGVENALASYAEESYNKLSEREQQQAQRIFIQLVRPGEGTEVTRRVAIRSEAGEDNWSMVTTLASARLVVTGRDEVSGEETVEVVHEALVERWERLRTWVEKDREFRIWQEVLRVMLHRWETSNKNEDALLRGVFLAEAQEWMEKRSDAISSGERAFIQASLLHQQREIASTLPITGSIRYFNIFLRWLSVVLEIGLLLRFILRLIGANSANPFAGFLYALTNIVLYPFSGIVGSASINPPDEAFEFSTLIAMLVYWLIFYAIRWFLRILITPPEEANI